MSSNRDEYGIAKDVDDDYIDVEEHRADIDFTNARVESDDNESFTVSARGVERSHRLDYNSGSGAASDVDGLIDASAVIETDGRSETWTFFYPEEASDEQRFETLREWQTGMYDTERDTKNKAADRDRWIDAFCGQVEVAGHLKERVGLVCSSLDLSHMGPYSTEKVILAIISLVANENDRFIRNEARYKELVASQASDLGEIRSVRNLVKRKSDYYDG